MVEEIEDVIHQGRARDWMDGRNTDTVARRLNRAGRPDLIRTLRIAASPARICPMEHAHDDTCRAEHHCGCPVCASAALAKNRADKTLCPGCGVEHRPAPGHGPWCRWCHRHIRCDDCGRRRDLYQSPRGATAYFCPDCGPPDPRWAPAKACGHPRPPIHKRAPGCRHG